MVPLKPLALCSLLFIWGYKDAQCKSPVKLLYEESDDNDDRGSDEKQYTIRKVADNVIDATDIWNSEGNLPVEYDGKSRSLFKKNEATSEAIRNTFTKFTSLFRFYNKVRGSVDPCVQEKKDECNKAQSDFLDDILNAEPIKKLRNRQQLKTIDLKEYLKKIWFTAYGTSAGNKRDSSGFEHVFLGEINQTGHVIGLHNWMRMYEEEVGGNFKLNGRARYYPEPENIAAQVWFEWHNAPSKMSNFLMYKSPAMGIALYTLCFTVCPGKKCTLQLGQTQLHVQTRVKKENEKDLIDSAYPVF